MPYSVGGRDVIWTRTSIVVLRIFTCNVVVVFIFITFFFSTTAVALT